MLALTLTNEVVAAVVVAAATIVAAMIAVGGSIILAKLSTADRHVGVVEQKIDGIKNGMPHEVKAAIAQLLREKAERDLYGLPLRRIGDVAPVLGVVPSEIPTHNENEIEGHTHSPTEDEPHRAGSDPHHTHQTPGSTGAPKV